MNIDIDDLNEFAISELEDEVEQLQKEIKKLKAESQANLDGWKQARRIIEKMNKRLRK